MKTGDIFVNLVYYTLVGGMMAAVLVLYLMFMGSLWIGFQPLTLSWLTLAYGVIAFFGAVFLLFIELLVAEMWSLPDNLAKLRKSNTQQQSKEDS